MTVRDLVVIGGGPAGMSAAVFAASEGLDVVLVTESLGGQAGTSAIIENYLGFPVGVSGEELGELALLQSTRFGVEIRNDCSVFGVDDAPDGLLVVSTENGEIVTKTVLIAVGMEYRELDVLPRGKHVSYGQGTKSFDVTPGAEYLVYGGANSAAQAAVDLAERGANVDLVSRSPLSKGTSKYMLDKIAATPEVNVLEGVTVSDSTSYNHDIAVDLNKDNIIGINFYDHVFAFVGGQPRTSGSAFSSTLAPNGKILTGPDVPVPAGVRIEPFETSHHNVFAVGDVRFGSIPRVAAAVGEGAAVVPIIWKRINE